MCGGDSKFRWRSYSYGLARRLTTLRTMRGLTQERLAELSGVSRNQISNIERNIGSSGNHVNPRLETIYQLARALEVPVVALLPASGEILQPILPAETVLNVDVVWPARPTDVVAFDHRHLSEELPQQRGSEEYSNQAQKDAAVEDEASAQAWNDAVVAFHPSPEDDWLLGVEWPWAPRSSRQPATH